MLHLNIITVGKLKEKYWQQSEAEYLKRLTPWAKVKIIELKEEPFDNKSNPGSIKSKEAQKILTALPKNSFLVILNPDGQQFNSGKLAEKLNDLTMKQVNDVTFVIGGPLGLDKDILKMADLELSLSKLTFTHQMTRIILLEQIYRSFTIINNKKYNY